MLMILFVDRLDMHRIVNDDGTAAPGKLDERLRVYSLYYNMHGLDTLIAIVFF